MKSEEFESVELEFSDYQSVLDYTLKYVLSNSDITLLLDIQMAKDVLEYISLDTPYNITGKFNSKDKIIMITRVGNQIIIENAYDSITGKLIIGISAKCIFILESLGITKEQISFMDFDESVIVDDRDLVKIKRHVNKSIQKDTIESIPQSTQKNEMETTYVTDDGFGNDYNENYYKLDPKVVNELLGDMDIQKANLIEDIIVEYAMLIQKIRFSDEELIKWLLELVDDILEIKQDINNK